MYNAYVSVLFRLLNHLLGYFAWLGGFPVFPWSTGNKKVIHNTESFCPVYGIPKSKNHLLPGVWVPFFTVIFPALGMPEKPPWHICIHFSMGVTPPPSMKINTQALVLAGKSRSMGRMSTYSSQRIFLTLVHPPTDGWTHRRTNSHSSLYQRAKNSVNWLYYRYTVCDESFCYYVNPLQML